MKSKFNPIDYMLIAYKNYIGPTYSRSFILNDEEMNMIKLNAFCKTLVSIMNFKGFNYSLSDCDKKIDIFYDSTLMLTYDISIIRNINSERALKFQLFCEWGLLQELTDKKKCLIAM